MLFGRVLYLCAFTNPNFMMTKKLLAAALLLPTLAMAQEKLTPEKLWQLGRVSEEQVSPDGKQIVFGVTNYELAANKGNKDLYMVSVQGGEPKRLTSLTGSEFNPRFRPDGKKIGFLAAQNGQVQLWEMNPDGTEQVVVSHVEGGITGFEYSPTIQHVLYTADVKLDATVTEVYKDLPKADARIIDGLMYRHWADWHDYAYSHVFVAAYKNGEVAKEAVDLLKNERFDAPTAPMGGMEEITWSKDGKTVAYTCKKLNGTEAAISTNSDIYLYDLATGKTRNASEGMNGYDKEPVFSPDGKKLVWESMANAGFESDKTSIILYDLATGKRENITETMEEAANNLVWSADSRYIYFTSGLKATVQAFEIEVKTKKIRQITQGTHNYNSLALAGKTLIAEKTTMSLPTELYAIDLKTGKDRAITQTNEAALSKLKLGKVEQRLVKTTDNKDMLVWVIYPPDFDAKKKYPTLLYCQGGPQSTVNQSFSYRWNFQLMAANGYIVVAPNRRGLPSFGKAWNDDISGDWGGQPIRDYYSAIDALAKEPFVDKDRLGAVGASYGGYSVYQLAGTHNKRFKTFIAHCGLFNLESWYGTTEEMFFANWDIKGAYWQTPQPKSYEQFSPHKFVKNWDTPILVIHGGKDFRVPESQGMEAFQAAQLKGIPSKFLYFPEEGHWITKPQNSVVWNRVFFEWLDKWLK